MILELLLCECVWSNTFRLFHHLSHADPFSYHDVSLDRPFEELLPVIKLFVFNKMPFIWNRQFRPVMVPQVSEVEIPMIPVVEAPVVVEEPVVEAPVVVDTVVELVEEPVVAEQTE